MISLLDPIMRPLLALDPLFAVFLISLTLSVLITIVYKLMTDQEVMKSMKKEMKDMQKEMKKFKDNPEKMLSIQKKMMEKNMRYMTQSIKPSLITLLPILLIFGWLNANFAFEPLTPGEEFDVIVELKKEVYGNIELVAPPIENSVELIDKDGVKEIRSTQITYTLQGEEVGEWNLAVKVNNETTYPFSVVISDTEYGKKDFTQFDSGSDIKKISVGYPKKIVMNLFGFEIGWLFSYIIFSLVFSIGLRKLLRLH